MNLVGRVYDTAAWERVRQQVILRDGGCSVRFLLGGECKGVISIHHVVPLKDGGDPYDVDNCAGTCQSHHVLWESIRLFIERSRRQLPPCRHVHRYAHAQEACDRKRAARLGIVLDQAA